MSDSEHALPIRSRDIDVSKSSSWRWPRPKLNGLWAVALVLLVAVASYLGKKWYLDWMPVLALGLVPFAMAGWIGWILIVRRGILTWARLARAPAWAMARGDKVEAERVLCTALERARQFSAQDHRRGLMLLELAAYVKNQGRYREAKALFEESIDIFAQRWRSNPIDYFVALNNYAVYLIDVCDFVPAQNTLEKVLDLTLFWKKGPGAGSAGVRHSVPVTEACLHLNLVFLFVQMDALDEAADHLEEADKIVPKLTKQQRAALGDFCHAIRGHFLYAQGSFVNAAHELDKVKNQDYPPCLHVRAKLHLVGREFPQAEQLLRRFFGVEGKKGSVHRPDLRDHTMDLAESLFGERKYDEAFSTLQEARAIVADFALPLGTSWQRALARWVLRAKELGRTDLLASLENDLQQILPESERRITISTRLRVRAL